MDYVTILERATLAARAACKEYENQYHGKEPQHLNCGFAWVKVPDKRHPFVRAMKAILKNNGLKYDSSGNLRSLDGGWPQANRRDYAVYGAPCFGKGWQWWNPGGTHWQDVDCKVAGTQAFAKVLRENGIQCVCGQRLD